MDVCFMLRSALNESNVVHYDFTPRALATLCHLHPHALDKVPMPSYSSPLDDSSPLCQFQ